VADASVHTSQAGVDPLLTLDDEAALAEEVDIEVEARREILAVHRSLDGRDHYALLGVDRSADRKTVKRAYFDLAARYHPDKYFRKRLGSFKFRMEMIFGRLTLAHDTLTHPEKRQEYDAYLEEQRRSQSIEELLADALAEVRRAEENAEREARDAVPSTPPTPSAPSTPPTPSPVVDAAARREALARRLLGGRPRPTPAAPAAPATGLTPTSSRPPVTSAPSTGDAMAALRRRYEEHKAMARMAQARKYVATGESALASGDAVAAANAFRVALSLSPDDPELVERAGDAQGRADTLLAETYTKQASYEEKNDQWSDASRSWARVCKVRPNDATAHERAAHAMLKAETDLHEASRLAMRACGLEPKNVAFRITLASVYLEAGLALNARRELETAAQLAPHDGTIQAMLKRVGKSA
jgi:curved DNA-binding protein CbpA